MANIREQGINTLWATCQRIGCGHEAKVDASRFRDDMPVPDVGLRLRSSKCGGRNVYTVADWSEGLASALWREMTLCPHPV
jgi:hypothetical protein